MNEKKEPKVSNELAEQDFERFADMMDLDLDTSGMDSDDITQFTKLKKRIIRAIEKGAMIINDSGEAVYTPQNAKTKHKDALTFHERTGASLMAMDGKKKNYDVTKTYAVMADMCKVHPNVFAGQVGLDAKICEALFALLMD